MRKPMIGPTSPKSIQKAGTPFIKKTSGSQWSGQRSGRYRRRWWRRYGYGTQDASSQWAVGIQACLAQLVGPWVPQNGIIGPRTRRAVQIFQGQQQLPVTGLLDNNTVAALQSACSGQSAGPSGPPGSPMPPGPPGPPMPPPPMAAPPDAGGGPDAAGPPDAGGPEDAGEAEITFGESEQELRVDGPCQVAIVWHDPVPLAREEDFHWAPDAPAVYVTYVAGKPWHVGIAEHNLRCHLLARAKTLKEFNIGSSALANRSVAWASLRSGAVPRCAIQRRHGVDLASPFHPIHAKHGILGILKGYFIEKFQTSNKGNAHTEKIQFGPGGSLVVIDKGKPIAKLSAGNLL